ncbi:hypothetical protein SAMN04488587_0163 [Methanococcoides vulcani]|uniref:Chromosome segregation ATPase n=1 Tax=Methanococcoides vulcani TaxID=1353158 RepID=A0A1H9Y2C9_9EURY|nr:hypothetical protein [Methanococcoides vulcani]SES62862.1 hypothetical protein SAMN04488587_0163 [Methanococcoides vulcani]
MKYTFQDSNELSIQRDVIQDLQDFVDTSRKVLPIENASIEKNDDLISRRTSLENGSEELESINSKILDFIDSITGEVEEKDLLDYRNSILDACETSFNKSSGSMLSEIEIINKDIDDGLDDVERQILSILDPFFEGGVYGTTEKYFASMDRNVLRGKLTSTVVGMEYESELAFTDNTITMRGLYGTLFLPTWTRSGIIYKEDKVKLEEVSDFLLSSLDFDDNHISATFVNKKSTKRFKVDMSGDALEIYYDGNEVTADPALMNSVKEENVKSMLDALKDYIRSHVKKKTLVRLMLDGEDAIRNNQTFDCLKLIAEQFTDIINECIGRGYVEGEITIKIEQNDGTRTEKYVGKTELFDQLSEFGSEGLELASLLGVESS